MPARSKGQGLVLLGYFPFPMGIWTQIQGEGSRKGQAWAWAGESL